MKSSFVIIADRAHLRAFRVEKGPTGRPAHLEEVRNLSFEGGQAKLGEVHTDEAGRYGNSTSDKHYELEADKRTSKHLSEAIEKLLGEQKPTGWAFAAPAEIKEGVLAHLSGESRKTLTESIAQNLVKIAPSALADHFATMRAA